MKTFKHFINENPQLDSASQKFVDRNIDRNEIEKYHNRSSHILSLRKT